QEHDGQDDHDEQYDQPTEEEGLGVPRHGGSLYRHQVPFTTTVGPRRGVHRKEYDAMPSERIWRSLERFANVIGILVVLAALGRLSYFASLGIHLVRPSSG
ncbi:MAG: hypothetical protein ACRELW_24370, partial [Candidatus Rokuibacteriota bacterium]